MIFKKIQLDPDNKEVYLEAYICDKITSLTRDAILVIPGGGYGEICCEREGEPIAHSFIPYGYNAFILHYSVKNDGKVFPAQLIQASLAVKHIKDNAEEYGINPDRIFACGFSAGGHLCATLGTMWHNKAIYDAVDMPYGYNKPAGVMLIYPVISSEYHTFSFQSLLGKEEFTKAEGDLVSVDKHVDDKSSPAFILHTSTDKAVDVRNSLAIAKAYADKGLQFELHIYPDAPHGVALANKITKCDNPKYDNASIAKWVENAVFWANSIE